MDSPYNTLQAQLASAGSTTSAAEAHGALSGLSCGLTGASQVARDWAAAIEINGDLSTDLANWPNVIATTLGDDGLRYHPLLPADDAPLHERLIALAEWSNGVLYGYGLANNELTLSAESQEFLRDLTEISRIDVDDLGEDDNEGEAEYFELTEYLKVGMILLYNDCHEQTVADGASSAELQ